MNCEDGREEGEEKGREWNNDTYALSAGPCEDSSWAQRCGGKEKKLIRKSNKRAKGEDCMDM